MFHSFIIHIHYLFIHLLIDYYYAIGTIVDLFPQGA